MSLLYRAAGRLRRLVIHAWRQAAGNLAYWLAAGDTGSCIHTRTAGDAPLTDQVCVFAHFDRDGVLRPHTRRYLAALAAEGLSIVLVDNSPALQPESLLHLQRCCAQILQRYNRGYDFGAYRDGLLQLDLTPGRLQLLVLANDSVYAPVAPMAALFAGMDFGKADVWAATDSWQHRYHLQSYMMGFGPAALAHPGFLGFWREVRNLRRKWAVVLHYEIGLTRSLQAMSLRCEAVFDYLTLIRQAEDALNEAPGLASPLAATAERAVRIAARRGAMNPVIDLWLLLMAAGSPFLKRELLRDNPTRAVELRAWHRLVQASAPALYEEVVMDMKRILRHVAP